MCCGVLALAFLSTPPQFADISFGKTWTQKNASAPNGVVFRNSPVFQLEAFRSGGGGGTLSLHIQHPPQDRKLVLTFWLKGEEDGQWISIDTKASRSAPGGDIPAQLRINLGQGYITTQYARVSREWKPYMKELVVSRSAKDLSIEVANIAGKSVSVAAPTLEIRGSEMCDLDGPGVLRANINVWVNPVHGHDTGIVSFPIPIPHEDQAPLAIKFSSRPVGAIRSLRFVKRQDGLNWLCEATVRASKSTSISWESLVYKRPHAAKPLPKAFKPEAPPQTAKWLERTACVQTDSPSLKKIANRLATDNPDIETYVRRVIKFSCDNRGGNAEMTRLDAEFALSCAGGGSCTSRANLAAALLRIHGIPARTVAHLPTWCYGEPLFTHWLVEYWHPKAGWASVESTWGEFQPPPYVTAILAICSPEDEDQAFDKLQARWVLPGAPMWAMAHLGADLAPDPNQNQQANWARPERRIAGSAAELAKLFRAAGGAYEASLNSKKFSDPAYFRRIEKAMASGKAAVLAAAISKG